MTDQTRQFVLDIGSFLPDLPRHLFGFREIHEKRDTENEKAEEDGNKKCRNCKNSDHERFDNGIRHILLRRDLHIRRAQVNHKICAFELVQMQLPCQLGGKIPSVEFDDARLFLTLPSDAVCRFGGFQRRNLHQICQEESDADCGDHADDNL